MDRRATIATIFGRQRENKSSATQRTSTLSVAGLEPFTGTFDRSAAAHLLRRVTFGPNYEDIRLAESEGLDATLAKIFEPIPVDSIPINTEFEDDPACAIGETWTDKPSKPDPAVWSYRQRSLFSWTAQRMLKKSISIQEKLVLFWHNHFVIGDIDDPRYVYTYSQTLRTHAMGNFRDFAKAISIDPGMLRYLNNNQNVASSPNENFARELVELFTLGKGDLVGPGDYTNYTEDDIQAMAKILTGWEDTGWFAEDDTPVGAKFNSADHDNSNKQLSNRFGNAIVEGAGIEEYSNLIDVIFQQPACANYICTKIYRWFVSDHIDETIQSSVIDPMSQLLIDSDYEVLPVLQTLFKSAHFFSADSYGCAVKSPIDFIYGIIRQFEMELTTAGDVDLYRQTLGVFYNANLLGMQYYKPPNVAGWKAYYQAPGLHRIWINSVSLPKRTNYAYNGTNKGFSHEDTFLFNDMLTLINKMDNPNNPNSVLEEFALLLLPRPLSQGQLDFLKNILIPGLPDFEWTVEYTEYAIDPTNEDKADAIRSKVQKVLFEMTTMAEYQLM